MRFLISLFGAGCSGCFQALNGGREGDRKFGDLLCFWTGWDGWITDGPPDPDGTSRWKCGNEPHDVMCSSSL